MPEYQITYTETVTFIVTVEADTPTAARRAVREDSPYLGESLPIAHGTRRVVQIDKVDE